MTVTGDVLGQIRQMAVDAVRTHIDDSPVLKAEGRNPLVIRGDGSVEELRLTPPPRAHALTTLASAIAMIRAAAQGRHGGRQPSVWLAVDRLSILLDDEDRRDHVTLRWEYTPQWLTLASGSAATPRQQQDLVRLLRIDLAGTLTGQPDLLRLVRNVRFNAGQTGEVSIHHGKESMGRSITAEVLGYDALPENVTLNVRVFTLPDFAVVKPIVCALDVLPQEQLFRLVPLPMQLNDAEEAALRELQEVIVHAIGDAGVPLYAGSPFPD